MGRTQNLTKIKQPVIKNNCIDKETSFVHILQNIDANIKNENDDKVLYTYENTNKEPIEVLGTYTTTLKPGARILVIEQSKKDILSENISNVNASTETQYDIINSNNTTENLKKTKTQLMAEWLSNSNQKLQESMEKVNELEKQLYLSEDQKELLLKELLTDFKVNIEDTERDFVAQGIKCIKKERSDMKNIKIKLDYSIPNITIIYIIISSILLTFFLMSFILTVFRNIYIMHPFFSFSSTIGALGILVTSVVSIKDWREFIKNGK